MDQYLTTYSPRQRIKIYSIDGTEKFDISDDITSISTNKAYGRCSGTWQLILPYKGPAGKADHYHQLIVPDDIITIELDPGDGTGLHHVMTGLVDRVGVVRTGGTLPQRAIKLSGRDMGKLLEKHDVAYDVLIMDGQIQRQPTEGSVEQPQMSRLVDPAATSGTAAKIISHAFNNFFKPYLTAGNRYSLLINTDDTWHTTQPNMMKQTGTSFWQYIQQVDNRPYNVLTTDADPTRVGYHVVTLEKYPCDNSGHLNRPDSQTVTVDDTEIVADDLGISDSERVNFLFNGANLQFTSSDLHKDAWAAWWASKEQSEMKDHGLCNWTINSIFTPPGPKTNKDKNEENLALPALMERQAILWQWHYQNHDRVSGSMTLHLRPDIRAGFQLLAREGDTDKYISYLVEQVAHQCTFHPMPSFTTTLHLTRGQYTTPAQKEQVQPPQPAPKPEPKVEPPPFDCEAAYQKFKACNDERTGSVSEYKSGSIDLPTLRTKYNDATDRGNAVLDEARSKSCPWVDTQQPMKRTGG